MIGCFVLFVEGIAVVGESINLVDDFDVITVIFDFGLEYEYVVFIIFL